jgi:hypothetical protein
VKTTISLFCRGMAGAGVLQEGVKVLEALVLIGLKFISPVLILVGERYKRTRRNSSSECDRRV